MRQTNATFIAILNRMRTNTQTNSDIAYLYINCMRPAPNDPTFPYLFYKKKDLATHINDNMLLVMPGNEIVISVIDKDEENHSNMSYHSHIAVLPP